MIAALFSEIAWNCMLLGGLPLHLGDLFLSFDFMSRWVIRVLIFLFF